jgi:sugar phosphate isomerase/epimerase
MSDFALAHLTLLDTAPPTYFDLAAAAGFRTIGLRLHPASVGGAAYPMEPRSDALRQCKRQLQEANLRIFDVEFVSITPNFNALDYRGLLDAAAELGAQRLNVSGDDEDFERLATHFAEVCDLAGAHGMGVDLEFMRWRQVATIEDALYVVNRADRPNGRILVDALHLFRSGGTVEDLAAIPKERLGALQLSDAPKTLPTGMDVVEEARTCRYGPGEGELDLAGIMRVISESLPLGVEVPTQKSVPAHDAAARARYAFSATDHFLRNNPAGGRK